MARASARWRALAAGGGAGQQCGEQAHEQPHGAAGRAAARAGPPHRTARVDRRATYLDGRCCSAPGPPSLRQGGRHDGAAVRRRRPRGRPGRTVGRGRPCGGRPAGRPGRGRAPGRDLPEPRLPADEGAAGRGPGGVAGPPGGGLRRRRRGGVGRLPAGDRAGALDHRGDAGGRRGVGDVGRRDGPGPRGGAVRRARGRRGVPRRRRGAGARRAAGVPGRRVRGRRSRRYRRAGATSRG